jgi:maltose/moltooligosaccharide transporter
MSTITKPRLSFSQINNMSFGFFGIQFGWGLQLGNMSPIYKYLGADEASIPLLWLAGPITGLIVQPIIGAMSDNTWHPRWGRRRPYFLVGAILASICLFLMPYSSTLWMAAGLLWILDASVNVAQEPFRAFVADKLPEEQHTQGFAMQTFFCGFGQTMANFAPALFGILGIVGVMASGIPLSVQYSFMIGAFVFLGAILWTVFTTDEYPPDDMAAFEADKQKSSIANTFSEIGKAMLNMPQTMKQLAIVQFFTWFGLMCMWQYFTLALARSAFGTSDAQTPAFQEATVWGNNCFAIFNIVTFLVSFALAPMSAAIGRKKTYFLCLLLGGIGLALSVMTASKYVAMVGLGLMGIAWAAILTMPYVILANTMPKEKMGVYMGLANMLVVIPQMVMMFFIANTYHNLFASNPVNVVILGGVMLIISALTVFLLTNTEVHEQNAQADKARL